MSVLRRMLIAAIKRAGLREQALSLRDQMSDVFVPLRRMQAMRFYRPLFARDAGLLLAYYDGKWEAVRRDERLVAYDVLIGNLDLVATALERHDIPYFVLPLPTSPNRYRIGVPETYRPATFDALTETSDVATHLYVDDAALAPRRRRIAMRRVSRRVRGRALRRPVWRAYVNHADAGGRSVLGHLHGCEIEFWSPPEEPGGAPGALVAKRWNRHVTELPGGLAPTGTIEIRDRRYPTLHEVTTAAHFQEVTFPVDLVYTWVDGADPAWLERKNTVLRDLNLDVTSRDADYASRYRNRDELKYSLRSVAMFADFVRHIYIVADDQVPEWLDTDNPRITVVGHKEIFGEAGRLPTFNSHAIEARLHHIDGLAEHYVYLNDDFLFCRRVTPETFFSSNGLSYFFPSNALIGLTGRDAVGRSVDDAARNSQELIERHFGRVTHQKMKHTPYPQRRSVLFEAEETFPEEFRATAASQIRSATDLPVASAFSHYYGYLTGRAVPGTITARYVELSADDFDRRLRDLERKRNADTLCINDAELTQAHDPAGRERRLEEFLDTYWPVPSEFER